VWTPHFLHFTRAGRDAPALQHWGKYVLYLFKTSIFGTVSNPHNHALASVTMSDQPESSSAAARGALKAANGTTTDYELPWYESDGPTDRLTD